MGVFPRVGTDLHHFYGVEKTPESRRDVDFFVGFAVEASLPDQKRVYRIETVNTDVACLVCVSFSLQRSC